MSIFFNVILGFVLGLDAFSLLVSLSSFDIDKKDGIILISLIGIFHFFFPILGSILGGFIHIPTEKLKIMVFFFLMIEMYLDYFNHKKLIFISSIISLFILAFSVSIDSFSIGISIPLDFNIIISCIIYSLCSVLFSYIGFMIGKYLNENYGKYANILGIVLIMIVLVCQIVSS